jgi:hypothetical protein
MISITVRVPYTQAENNTNPGLSAHLKNITKNKRLDLKKHKHHEQLTSELQMYPFSIIHLFRFTMQARYESDIKRRRPIPTARTPPPDHPPPHPSAFPPRWHAASPVAGLLPLTYSSTMSTRKHRWSSTFFKRQKEVFIHVSPFAKEPPAAT